MWANCSSGVNASQAFFRFNWYAICLDVILLPTVFFSHGLQSQTPSHVIVAGLPQSVHFGINTSCDPHLHGSLVWVSLSLVKPLYVPHFLQYIPDVILTPLSRLSHIVLGRSTYIYYLWHRPSILWFLATGVHYHVV